MGKVLSYPTPIGGPGEVDMILNPDLHLRSLHVVTFVHSGLLDCTLFPYISLEKYIQQRLPIKI